VGHLVVDGLSYWAGPGAPAAFPGDATGRMTVIFQATGLAMPVLTFSATNPNAAAAEGAQRWCQGDVVEVKPSETATPASPSSMANRLAGNDASFPVNASALEKAGLLDPDYHGKSDAITAITQIGNWILQNAQGSAPNRVKTAAVRHWRFERTPSGARCHELTPDEAQSIHAGASAAGLGGPFDWIGDAINWAKHSADELTSITVSIGDDFEMLINDAISFVVNQVRQAAEVLEIIFIHIKQVVGDVVAVIEEIIEWLKMLFDWGDILLTHKVMKYCLKSFLAQLENSVDELEGLVKQQADKVVADVSGFFDTIDSYPWAGQTFNQYANNLGKPPLGPSDNPNVLAAQPAADKYNQNVSQCLYVYSRAKNFFDITSPRPQATADVTGILTAVKDVWNISEFDQILEQMKSAVLSLHFNEFFDIVISDFVKLIKDIVIFGLKGAETVVIAILDTAKTAVAGLLSLLEQTIDIPVISWVYKYIITSPEPPFEAGDDLTILDLLCLVLAVPATILYKLLMGGTAPFTGDMLCYLEKHGLPWLGLATGASLSLSAGIAPPLWLSLGVVGGVLNLVGGIFTAWADYLAFYTQGTNPLITVISWVNIVQEILAQAFTAPFELWSSGLHNVADYLTTTLWGLASIPVIYDSFFTFTRGELARFISIVGPLLDTVAGGILTIFGLITMRFQMVAPDFTGWDAANSPVPQIDRVFRSMLLLKRLVKDDPEFQAILAYGLAVVDLALGAGAATTQIGAAIEG
jgi:hypothetical protein